MAQSLGVSTFHSFTLRSSTQQQISLKEVENGAYKDKEVHLEEDYTTDTSDDTDSIFDSNDEYDEFSSDIDSMDMVMD